MKVTRDGSGRRCIQAMPVDDDLEDDLQLLMTAAASAHVDLVGDPVRAVDGTLLKAVGDHQALMQQILIDAAKQVDGQGARPADVDSLLRGALEHQRVGDGRLVVDWQQAMRRTGMEGYDPMLDDPLGADAGPQGDDDGAFVGGVGGGHD